MRRILKYMAGTCVLALAGVSFAADPAKSASASKSADEVIAITKAIWAADIKKDVAGQVKYLADDYTEINPDYPVRLDGKAIATHLAEANNSGPGSTLTEEMANEKVQVYGDTAILTYNYVGVAKDKDGKTTPDKAVSTRVFVKMNGQWMLVHAHFSEVK
jgi:ketosteroid isomerase-like protein